MADGPPVVNCASALGTTGFLACQWWTSQVVGSVLSLSIMSKRRQISW